METLKNENAELKLENPKLNDSDHQERFRTIFEYSRLANKIISADLKIIEVNQALVKLLGYDTKEDIIGTRILDYSPPEHHAHWKLLQEHLWQRETPFFAWTPVSSKKTRLLSGAR